MAKVKAGIAQCDAPGCGEQVVWRKAESGTLSYTCQHCDFRGYAPAHSDAAKRIAVKFAPAEPAPAVKPVATKPAQAVKPEPKPEPAAKPATKPGGIWDHLVKGAAA